MNVFKRIHITSLATLIIFVDVEYLKLFTDCDEPYFVKENHAKLDL